jgi:putative thioredoxin
MSGKMGRAFRALGVALTAGALLFSGVHATAATAPAAKAAGEIVEVTDQNFDQLMQQSQQTPFILDFGKEHCLPCEQLAPVLEARAQAEGEKLIIGHLDGTKYPKLWEKYGKPFFLTLIGIKGGQELSRRTGYDGNADAVNQWITDVMNGTPPPADPLEMDVTSQNLQQALGVSRRKPVVMKFGAQWCGPCQQLAPVLTENVTADNGKWMVGKVDGDASPELVEKYKVDGYPTLVVFYKGVEQEIIERFVGFEDTPQMRERLRTWIDKVLSTKYPAKGAEPAPARSVTAGALVAAR